MVDNIRNFRRKVVETDSIQILKGTSEIPSFFTGFVIW